MQTENIEDNENQEEKIFGKGIKHPGARPMKVFVDEDGCWWLCDKDTNTEKPFNVQNCWRCQDIPFTRND